MNPNQNPAPINSIPPTAPVATPPAFSAAPTDLQLAPAANSALAATPVVDIDAALAPSASDPVAGSVATEPVAAAVAAPVVSAPADKPSLLAKLTGLFGRKEAPVAPVAPTANTPEPNLDIPPEVAATPVEPITVGFTPEPVAVPTPSAGIEQPVGTTPAATASSFDYTSAAPAVSSAAPVAPGFDATTPQAPVGEPVAAPLVDPLTSSTQPPAEQAAPPTFPPSQP